MRFGAALDLWHKGDLHADDNHQDTNVPKADAIPAGNGTVAMISDAQRDLIQTLAEASGKPLKAITDAYKVGSLRELSAKQGEAVIARLQPAKEPTNA